MASHRFARSCTAAAFTALFSVGAQAQAPRGNAEVQLGATQVSLEFGCPPWSARRKSELDHALAADGLWRVGADSRTTLVVRGGALRLGDLVVEEGGVGLNVRRLGEQQWNFVVYDGGEATAQLADNFEETAATFTEKSDAAPERLQIAFVEAGGKRRLSVRFGPWQLEAPVAAVTVNETEMKLGGENVVARWFSVAEADAPPAGTFTRVGASNSFFVGEPDCAFLVDARFDGKSATIRCTNRGAARIDAKSAELRRELAVLKQAGGSAAQQAELTAQIESLASDRAALGDVPKSCEVTVPLAPAAKASGRFGARLERRGAELFVVVDAGAAGGAVKLDEAQLLPGGAKH